MPNQHSAQLSERYRLVRRRSESLAAPLPLEDYVVQAAPFASPAKWHLAHTTWFFEQLVLAEHHRGYHIYDETFSYLFNSYYETVGKRHARPARGLLTRPTVEQVYAYRRHVDDAVATFLSTGRIDDAVLALIELGINHEQQHQELFVSDLKYNLGTQPTHPAYAGSIDERTSPDASGWVDVPEGMRVIGHAGDGFCFDNELPRHKTYVHAAKIRRNLVTNGEYLAFVEDGGYRDHRHWHSDGFTWVAENDVEAPLYWHNIDGTWHEYTLRGLDPIETDSAVMHVSYYEAAAFASWAGYRLPTEFEWEAIANELSTGARWEWTSSAYAAYPGYRPLAGAVGEYNGKFMVNQMVLRGGCVATPPGHSRSTYRNFYYPANRWQYSGIRVAR